MRFVLCVWAVSRVFWLAVGALAPALVGDAEAGARLPPDGALADWAHWDGAWYLDLADAGSTGTGAESAGPHCQGKGAQGWRVVAAENGSRDGTGRDPR